MSPDGPAPLTVAQALFREGHCAHDGRTWPPNGRYATIEELKLVDGRYQNDRLATYLIPTAMDAPIKLAEALKRGSHVAALVDQYATQGVPVTFFGRRTLANSLVARLARQIDCPIHGIRIVRHPGNRFQLKITEAITTPRDAEGKVDVQRTMQVITDVVEDWVREHPEQWLWLHRRWRDA